MTAIEISDSCVEGKRKAFIRLLAVTALFPFSVTGNAYSETVSSKSYGLSRMTDVARFPVLDREMQVKYEGSVDKQVGNAEWDVSVSHEKKGERVCFIHMKAEAER